MRHPTVPRRLDARSGSPHSGHAARDAAGAGVASVYRLFESKRELLAALVVRRMDTIAAAAQEAYEQPGNRWEALTGMLRSLVSAFSHRFRRNYREGR